jgi:hypothetical protein
LNHHFTKYIHNIKEVKKEGKTKMMEEKKRRWKIREEEQ